MPREPCPGRAGGSKPPFSVTKLHVVTAFAFEHARTTHSSRVGARRARKRPRPHARTACARPGRRGECPCQLLARAARGNAAHENACAAPHKGHGNDTRAPLPAAGSAEDGVGQQVKSNTSVLYWRVSAARASDADGENEAGGVEPRAAFEQARPTHASGVRARRAREHAGTLEPRAGVRADAVSVPVSLLLASRAGIRRHASRVPASEQTR